MEIGRKFHAFRTLGHSAVSFLCVPGTFVSRTSMQASYTSLPVLFSAGDHEHIDGDRSCRAVPRKQQVLQRHPPQAEQNRRRGFAACHNPDARLQRESERNDVSFFFKSCSSHFLPSFRVHMESGCRCRSRPSTDLMGIRFDKASWPNVSPL